MKKPYIICHMMTSVDEREEMPSVFDGLKMNHPLIHLKLMDVKKFASDAVWIRYKL